MNVIAFINNMLDLVNAMLDIAFLGVGLIVLVAYPIYFFFASLKKYTKERKIASLVSETVMLVILVFILGGIWVIPDGIWLFLQWRQALLSENAFSGLSGWGDLAWIFSSVRLAVILGTFFLFAYIFGREHGKHRWRQSAVLQIAVVFLGWLLNRWIGVILVSLPLLAAYYASLHDVGLVVMPASKPEDRAEQKKRVNAFLSYAWGIQSPMVVVDGHAWKKYNDRIPGDITWSFADFPFPLLKMMDLRPGVIWTPPHQVAAVSGGTQFKRVEGPGLIFTGKLERLDQVFDLRLQIRSKEIEVVSKDGIHFIARFFTAFRLDNEEWPTELYNTLRPMNVILRGANRLSHNEGSFHYSNLRVQATLGVTSTRATAGDPLVFWDQWVMNVIEDQTRKVISQKNLDEMWRPANDSKFANAMDVVARELKGNSEMLLRSAGILLVAARVVNFRFPPREGAKDGELDEISKQQIATWGSEWERSRGKILAEAQAESERAQQEARAYAESVLLNAIAEGLQKTHEINPQLPRYVIAMRFLSALQDYIHKEPAEGEQGEETRRRISDLQKEFKLWQEQFFPGEKG